MPKQQERTAKPRSTLLTVQRRSEPSSARCDDLATRRLVLSVGLLLVLAFGVDRLLGSHDFAEFSKAKAITLPLTYGVFGLAAALPRAARRAGTAPRWIWLLVAATLTGLTSIIVFPSMPNAPKDLAQGSLLFLGFAFLGWFGTQAVTWTERSRAGLIALLMVGGLLSGLLRSQGPTPFMVLGVLSVFAAAVLTLRSPNTRGRLALLTAVLGFLAISNIQTDDRVQISVATEAQFVICGGALALLLLVPRRMRATVIAFAVCAGTVIFTQRGGFQLLMGRFESADVTISHRSYEAHQVLGLLGKSPWATLVGYGPGATVDLTFSPDAATLEASGRNLAAVGSVHLLPADVLLKMGVLGLAWLVVLLAAVWRVSLSCLAPDSKLNTFRLVILMYLLAGVVDAFPAATLLMSNPLVPLLLGVLWATRADEPRPQQWNRPAR